MGFIYRERGGTPASGLGLHLGTRKGLDVKASDSEDRLYNFRVNNSLWSQMWPANEPASTHSYKHTNKTQGYSQKTVHRNVFRDTSSDIYFFYFKLKLVYSSILLSHIHTFGLGGSYKIPPNLLFEFKSKSISRTNHRSLFVPWHPWDISVSLKHSFPQTPPHLVSYLLSYSASFLRADKGPLIKTVSLSTPCSEQFQWHFVGKLKWLHISSVYLLHHAGNLICFPISPLAPSRHSKKSLVVLSVCVCVRRHLALWNGAKRLWWGWA